MRKKQLYIEIIDLKEEQKEYVKLCNGKSVLYKTYTAWETHIIEILQQFPTSSDLYNFKRYCINQDRISSKTPELFGSYIALVFTVILTRSIHICQFWELRVVYCILLGME